MKAHPKRTGKYQISDARRRGWECAGVMLQEFRARLTPRIYSLCQAAWRDVPERLGARRAKRLRRLFGRIVERRQ